MTPSERERRFIVQIRRRRRVARAIAAVHLLRYGSLIYGVRFRGGIWLGKNRNLLLSNFSVVRDFDREAMEREQHQLREALGRHFSGEEGTGG